MPSEHRRPSASLTVALLAALCLMGLLVYIPGLSGSFIFDDAHDIVQNPHIQIHSLTPQALEGAMATGNSGPLKRPLSMASFALNYYFTGLDPFYFKLTNVLIHLLNAAGLFFLSRLILMSYREHFEPHLADGYLLLVSFAVSAAWLVHPLNLTSVLYTVQRMTSLSAFFVIWGLVLYLAGRRRLQRGTGGIAQILTGALVCTPFAVLSKENGALLPLFMLIIEYTLFGLQAPGTRERRFLLGLFGLTVALPAVAVGAYTLAHPQWILAGYHIREFTLAQRLLTEARLLWFYIKQILMPSNTQLGLFHDDIPISHGLLDPPMTLFAVLGLALLAAAAVYSRRRFPLITLGVLWFLAGHSLESTVFPLELAAEHRNYLPMYGILLPSVYYLLSPFASAQLLRVRQGLVAGFIVLLAVSTVSRASDWGNPLLHALVTAQHHPDSPRSNSFAGRVYLALANHTAQPRKKAELDGRALNYFEKSARLPGNDLDGLFDALITRDGLKLPLDEHLVDTLVKRLKNEPFALNSANQIRGLIKCEMDTRCHFPLPTMQRILRATLDNPTLTGQSRVMVLLAASEQAVNLAGNYPEALDDVRRAAKIEPGNLAAQLSLAKLLIIGHRYDQAHAQLNKVKALDTWGIYTKQVAQQQRALSSAQGSRPPPQDVTSTPSSPVTTPQAAHPAQEGV